MCLFCVFCFGGLICECVVRDFCESCFKYVFFYHFPIIIYPQNLPPNLYPTIYLINYSNTKTQSIVDLLVLWWEGGKGGGGKTKKEKDKDER